MRQPLEKGHKQYIQKSGRVQNEERRRQRLNQDQVRVIRALQTVTVEGKTGYNRKQQTKNHNTFFLYEMRCKCSMLQTTEPHLNSSPPICREKVLKFRTYYYFHCKETENHLLIAHMVTKRHQYYIYNQF